MTEGNQATGPGRGAVVITGASTGLGRATALHLDSIGFQVFAGVRKNADAESLRSEGTGRLTPLMIDVADESSIASAKAEVEAAAGERGLAGLVNNAGIVVGGPLEFVPVEEWRRQIEINLIGQVAVTQAFLPLIRKGRGRIVLTGSIAGRVAGPMMGPYAASKFGIEAIADSLRIELRPWDIWVALIEPGLIASEIWDKATTDLEETRARLGDEGKRLYGDAVDGFEKAFLETGKKRGISPRKVATAVEHALTARRPKARYLIGAEAKAMARGKGLLSDRVFSSLTARAMRTPRRGGQLERD